MRLRQCMVCKVPTSNTVVLKSGLEVPVCEGESGCLRFDPNKEGRLDN